MQVAPRRPAARCRAADMSLTPQHARRLLELVKDKVTSFVPPEAREDDVLSEYILVMMQNGKSESQVATELEVFLGREARNFTDPCMQQHTLPQLLARCSPKHL